MQPSSFTPMTVDSRELAAHPSVGSLLSTWEIPFYTDTLRSADYVFISPYEIAGRVPTIGVEVSTVTDLVGKLDGRLSWQLGDMITAYDVPYLLIDGIVNADRDGFITAGGRQICEFNRLMDILHGAQAHGVIVIQSTDPYERLRRIYQYWHRPCDSHKYFRPNAVVRDVLVPVAPAIDERILFLMGAPGVGEDRATAALATFGSLLPILLAPVAALVKIPGWGKITAENFRQFIDRMD
jgi:ERCC4-type nuclease